MSENIANQIPKHTLSDFAYEMVKKDIITGYLVAGDKLNIPTLVDRYGISATPIKEALTILSGEGLIDNVSRRGYFVKEISSTEIEDLFELRLMMELYFISKASESVSTSLVLQNKFEKNIEENLKLAKTYTDVEDYYQVYELDRQFHELIFISTGNHTALKMFKNLNTHAYALFLFGKQTREKTIEGIEEHKDIYEAMKTNNPEKAASILSLHAKNATDKISMAIRIEDVIDELKS